MPPRCPRYLVPSYVSGSMAKKESAENVDSHEELFSELDFDAVFLADCDNISDWSNQNHFDDEFIEAGNRILRNHPHVPFHFTKVDFFNTDLKLRRDHAALNVTTTLQMLWQAKHGITNAAMKDFISMTNHNDFCPSLLLSGDQLRRKREIFPLLPLYSLNVSKTILPVYENGELVTSSSADFPFFSLIDVVNRFLQTPGRLADLNFTAIHAPQVKEQWHGQAYREIPQFTIDWVRTMNDNVIYIGDNWLYKDNTGNKKLCLVTGISHREGSCEVKLHLRNYITTPNAKKRKRAETPACILSEENTALNYDELDEKMIKCVRVNHKPSIKSPGNTIHC